MVGSDNKSDGGLGQVQEGIGKVEAPQNKISDCRNNTFPLGYGPLMDAMPAIIAAFEQYFDIHGKVEDFLGIMTDESLNVKDFYNLKEGLMVVELKMLDKLLVHLNEFLENSWAGTEKIFNDSGISLLSLICNLTVEFRGKDRNACFRSAGILRAWYVGELLSRRDRCEEYKEACDDLLKKIESVH